MRAHPEYHDLRGGAGQERWVQLVSLRGDERAATLDPARLTMASRMLETARTELREDQLAALVCWLQGDDDTAVAASLHLDDAEAARRLVRSALKRLRDRFRGRPAETTPASEGEDPS